MTPSPLCRLAELSSGELRALEIIVIKLIALYEKAQNNCKTIPVTNLIDTAASKEFLAEIIAKISLDSSKSPAASAPTAAPPVALAANPPADSAPASAPVPVSLEDELQGGELAGTPVTLDRLERQLLTLPPEIPAIAQDEQDPLAGSRKKTCSMCYDDVEIEDLVEVSCCGEPFHANCLYEIREGPTVTCPACITPIRWGGLIDGEESGQEAGAPIASSPIVTNSTSRSLVSPNGFTQKSFHLTFERTIGKGGCGRVELWRSPHLRVSLCGKVADLCDSEEVDSLRRETKVLNALQPHPHIIVPYGSGVHLGVSYMLLLQYHPLGDAMKFVEHNKVTTIQVVGLLEQLLSAVCYMGFKGYGHTDIKPKNMLLQSGEVMVLTDFGLAVPFGHRILGRTRGYGDPYEEWCTPGTDVRQAAQTMAVLFTRGVRLCRRIGRCCVVCSEFLSHSLYFFVLCQEDCLDQGWSGEGVNNEKYRNVLVEAHENMMAPTGERVSAENMHTYFLAWLGSLKSERE